MPSLIEAKKYIASELVGVVDNPQREAELLLRAYLECDELFFITHSDLEIDLDEPRLKEWIDRRSENYPLEYLTNRVSFYSEHFYIDEGALIPRPETELLIDEVLSRVDKNSTATIVEVGVGSGVISIILAQKLPNARFIAVDISPLALAVARKNIESFGLSGRIELRESDLLSDVDEHIDILISNPPYIASDAELDTNLSYEPQNALFGGEIGDEIIKKLLDESYERKIEWFFCEMGYDQRDKVINYLSNFQLQSLEFYRDLASFDRGFVLRW